MLTNHQVYSAFEACKQIYGSNEIHVQLIAKQLNVLAIEVVKYLDNNPTLATTRMLDKPTITNYAGLIVKSVTQLPCFTTDTVVLEGDSGAVITLTPVGDTVKTSTSTANWTIDSGTTGLSLASVNSGTATKALTFTGTVYAGTLSIVCKATGMTSGVISDEIKIVIPEQDYNYTTIKAGL